MVCSGEESCEVFSVDKIFSKEIEILLYQKSPRIQLETMKGSFSNVGRKRVLQRVHLGYSNQILRCEDFFLFMGYNSKKNS